MTRSAVGAPPRDSPHPGGQPGRDRRCAHRADAFRYRCSVVRCRDLLGGIPIDGCRSTQTPAGGTRIPGRTQLRVRLNVWLPAVQDIWHPAPEPGAGDMAVVPGTKTIRRLL